MITAELIFHIPFAIDHQGSSQYVMNAFNGVELCRRFSFQKWKVWVKPFVVHNGLKAPSSSSEMKIKKKMYNQCSFKFVKILLEFFDIILIKFN
jgi:hypothetical protein